MKVFGASFASGVLFAIGLGVSGMTKPAKVAGFLDLFGAWDASLALVMAGAVGVYFVLYRAITKRTSPLLDTRFSLPTRNDLDARLIAGSALFGIGWGLGGYCPGPGLVSAASGALPAVAFVLSMMVGMKIQHLTSARASTAREAPAASDDVLAAE